MNNTQTINEDAKTTRIEIVVGSRVVRIYDRGDQCISAYLILSDGQVNGEWSGKTVAGAKRWAGKVLSY
jgi:hypothetical protein